ncbi:hypothetical protein ACFVZD_48310, partial [Streptomyces sp. NPDC058287]|uniref:hypothetical protein n=1 Tax=Streptomyces sp. NPDC058287 TaxID=3346423 RepID=UPI0036F1081B
EITTPTTRGFATSPHLTSLFHSSDPRMKEVQSGATGLVNDTTLLLDLDGVSVARMPAATILAATGTTPEIPDAVPLLAVDAEGERI